MAATMFNKKFIEIDTHREDFDASDDTGYGVNFVLAQYGKSEYYQLKSSEYSDDSVVVTLEGLEEAVAALKSLTEKKVKKVAKNTEKKSPGRPKKVTA
jgi:hypothetical protein